MAQVDAAAVDATLDLEDPKAALAKAVIARTPDGAGGATQPGAAGVRMPPRFSFDPDFARSGPPMGPGHRAKPHAARVCHCPHAHHTLPAVLVFVGSSRSQLTVCWSDQQTSTFWPLLRIAMERQKVLDCLS